MTAAAIPFRNQLIDVSSLEREAHKFNHIPSNDVAVAGDA